MSTRVSLAELAAAGIQLRPAEAVVVVSEICRRSEAGLLRGVPPAGIVRLSRDGQLVIEGPTTTGDDVIQAAQLLNILLPGFDATPEYRASGALRLTVARAMGTLDLPPYESLAAFRAALERFATVDLAETVRGLFHAWDRTRIASDLEGIARSTLSISDIRRARRATGLTLQDVADAAGVPAVQLRDLEWGYMRNWHADAEGRAQVVRYARAAGLDEGLVLSVAWPLIEEAAKTVQGPVTVQALVPSGPQRMVRVHPVVVARRARRVPARLVAVAAAIVLVVAALLAAMSSTRPEPSVTAGHADAVEVDSASAAPPVIITSRPAAIAVPASAAPPRVVERRASDGPPRPSRRRPAPAPAPSKRHAQHQSFFGKELFRIVIK
jgi:hypothetical protein